MFSIGGLMFLKFTTTDFLFLLISWVIFHCNSSVSLTSGVCTSQFGWSTALLKVICFTSESMSQNASVLGSHVYGNTKSLCCSVALHLYHHSCPVSLLPANKDYLFCGLLCVCVCVFCFPNTSSCPLKVKLDKLFGNKIIIEFCHMQQHFRCWD
jgi:hypothetical protein